MTEEKETPRVRPLDEDELRGEVKPEAEQEEKRAQENVKG